MSPGMSLRSASAAIKIIKGSGKKKTNRYNARLLYIFRFETIIPNGKSYAAMLSLGQSPTSFGSFSCLETTHGRYVLRGGCTQLASTAKNACIPHMAVESGLFAKPTAFLTTFRKAPSCFAQQGKYLTISYLNVLQKYISSRCSVYWFRSLRVPLPYAKQPLWWVVRSGVGRIARTP